MPDVQTLDPASLDAFRIDLRDAGFSSMDGGRTWVGPLAAPLQPFTAASTMVIEIRDGWPYRQPEIRVPEIAHLAHVNEAGVVCLWQEGDGSRQWETLAGLHDRINEWAARQRTGFRLLDETMDAHAYFDGSIPGIARMDLAEFDVGDDGATAPLRARWRNDHNLLEITTDTGSHTDLKGSWFYRRSISAPPATLEDFADRLTTEQRMRFRELCETAKRGRDNKAQRLAVLVWGEGITRNAVVVLIDHEPSSVIRVGGKQRAVRGEIRLRARAIELAPADVATLRARSGDDASWLGGRGIVIFGAGAVGSHVALALAESGVGQITLLDAERLRPSNVVRHVAPSSLVGRHKVIAVERVIAEHAPWVQVTALVESPWSPSRLIELLGEHDLAVDATGNTGFADQLSRLAATQGEPIVSTALYRRGAVIRVSRQTPGDRLLCERDGSTGYPEIPKGAEEDLRLEPGCSAPVNAAPPRAVFSCAALTAQVVVDALRVPPLLADEITEVLEPLEVAPFDRPGRIGAGS